LSTMRSDIQTCFIKSGNPSPRLVLALAALAFLLSGIPRTIGYRFCFDDRYYLERIREAGQHPFSAFGPDYLSRYHPVYYLATAPFHRVFGDNPTAHGTLQLLLHVLNAWLLFRLMRTLFPERGSDPGVLAASLFLFYCGYNNVLADIVHVNRILALTFFLSGLLFYARFLSSGRRSSASLFGYTAFYILSLLTMEDGIFLPILAFALMMLSRRERALRPREYAHQLFPLLILLAYPAYILSRTSAVNQNRFGPHVLEKILAFPKEWLQHLVIPRVELVSFVPLPAGAARVIPVLLLAAFSAFFLFPHRRAFYDAVRGRDLPVLLCFLACTAAPYLFRATGWTWHSRYLYFPSVPASAITACLVSAAWQSREEGGRVSRSIWVAALLCFLFVFLLNAKTVDFMFWKIQAAGARF
jgi:hypothetical protein